MSSQWNSVTELDWSTDVDPEGLIDLDLGGMVTAGWRKEGELAAAAERTAADPDSAEVVELASQRITSKHRPYVDLLINDVHMATVGFELDIEWKGGKLTSAALRSKLGGPAKINYGTKVLTLKTQAGKTYRLDGALKLATRRAMT